MTDNAALDGTVAPDPMYSTIAGMLVRGVLYVASGAGFQWASTTTDQQATMIATGLVAIGTFAWSWYEKNCAKQLRHEAAKQSASRSAEATMQMGAPVKVAITNPQS